MKNLLYPQEEVFWFHKREYTPQKLKGSHTTDIVIVGGGMAGITAAQSFHEKGCKVTLLEHYHCGTGASGKSSGFVTANAELGLTHYVDVYGMDFARSVWKFVNDGVTIIENNIKKYGIACDYTPQDVLIVANSHTGFKDLTQEYSNYQKLGFESSLWNQQEIRTHINSDGFYGGLRFSNNFGMHSYEYIQAMKEILMQQGVAIYEETPVIKIFDNGVETADARVNADHVIVCADRFIPDLGKLTKEIYQVQTFITISSPLDDTDIATLFPNKRYMVWDTDLVYQYYRITGDNRLLIGGSTMWDSFRKYPTYNARSVYNKLTHYIAKKFPYLKLNFEYMWPGMIGISKDLQPIVGPDLQSPSIYYVGAATGLAWAAVLGNYAAQHILDKRTDFDELFSPQRKFPLGNAVQAVLGKKITFSLSNLIALKS